MSAVHLRLVAEMALDPAIGPDDEEQLAQIARSGDYLFEQFEIGPHPPFTARHDAAPRFPESAVHARRSNPTLERSALRDQAAIGRRAVPMAGSPKPKAF